jgi:hypothetical protein
MPRLAAGAGLALVSSAAIVAGCLSSGTAVPIAFDPGSFDGAIPPPPVTVDGAVYVDGGPEDGSKPTAFTGFGSGVVAHSAHFTIVTKTGNEPGGAGVKSSPNFKVVSGIAPNATK